MPVFLRQSTASQEVILGPFLDSTDGVTAETGLTIANTDIQIWKTGGTTEANKNSGGATHIAGGRYYCVLDATDTNTIGPMRLSVQVSGALAVWLDCCVLDEAVYDVLFGTTAPSTYAGADTSGTTTLLSRIGSALTITSGRVNADITHIAAAAVSTSTAQLGVNVVNFGGSAGTFASGRPAVNASYIGGVPVTATTSITFPSTCTVATTTGAVGSVTGAVGSVTGAVGSVTGNVGGNVVGSVGSVTGNVGGNVTGSVGSVATGGITAASLAADCITAAKVAADVSAEIADAVWDEVLSGHLTAGSTGAGLNAAGSAGDPWSTALPGAYSAGSAGYIVGTNLDAAVSTRSTYAGADTSGTTTLLSRLSATRAGYLDNLSGGAVALASGVNVTSWAGSAVATPNTGGYPLVDVDRFAGNTLDSGAAQVGVNVVNVDAAAVTQIQSGLATAANLATLTGYVDTEVAAIKAKTDNLPANPAATGDAMTLTSGERDSIAAALLDLANGVETSYTVRQALRAIAAACAGNATGAGTGTELFKALGNSGTTRITNSGDADGNRTITLNL